MNWRDASSLAKLLVSLRRIWFGFQKITPQMVTDSMKLLYQFFTGKTLSLLFLLCLLGCKSDNIEPIRVMEPPRPTLVLQPQLHSVIVPHQVLAELPPTPVVEKNEKSVRPSVRVHTTGDGSLGSGTLIHPDEVVTVYHMVRDSQRGIKVEFENGRIVPATIKKVNRTHDLCLLSIPPQSDIEPAELSTTKDYEKLTAKGYGGASDPYKEVTGNFIKWKRPSVSTAEAYTAEVSGKTRPGDSGAGIYNSSGLYGVLWGNDGDSFYGTSGKGFREFLGLSDPSPSMATVIGHRRAVDVSLPDHVCYPCHLQHPIILDLQKDGYDVTIVPSDEWTGPPAVDRCPTILFYEGDKVVAQETGVHTYKEIAEKVDKK